MRTIGEVAALAHVTVRTLHNYDELGLLAPSERSESGYRLYSYDDVALAAHRNGTPIEETTMFDGFDPTEYEDEARERWGHTDAYQESMRRTQAYGEAQWNEIRRESEPIMRELIGLMRAGSPADGPAARALAERHREHISRWFYPCSPQMHRGLAEMYVADERFTRTYESEAEGLAAYFHDAIIANANASASAVSR